MDRNFLLAIALSFAFLFLWSSLTQRSEAPPVGVEAPAETVDPGAPDAGPTTTAPQPAGSFESSARRTAPEEPEAEPAVPEVPEQRLTLESELWRGVFTSHGGALLSFELKDYDDASREGRPPVDLALQAPGSPPGLATPFSELGLGDLSSASYEVEQPDPYTLVFQLVRDGVTVRKTYELDPDAYLMRLRIQVTNDTTRFVRATFRVEWPAVAVPESADYKEYTVVAYQNGSFEQFPVTAGPSFMGFGGGSFEGQETFPEEQPGELHWAGAQMRYFVAAILPDVASEASARLRALQPGESALVEVAFNPIELPPGQGVDREYRIYLGPKETDRLDSVGGHLDEAILKGWFPALTRFFAWALTSTYGFVGNYGVAIILITLVVRLLMAPIMARQMKSMKRLSTLQPRMKEIQEKYKDDRQKQSEAMMAVYKEEGVSPFSAMAGCFPMLLQLPVFIGFYYALQGAIDLRQKPFMLWINDLSEPESIFVIPGLELPVRVLPLLMGASMVLQQKLTPTTMDPAQARMMLTMMPIMFTVLFYQFASGLVLYWLTSNLLGIAQQAITNRSRD